MHTNHVVPHQQPIKNIKILIVDLLTLEHHQQPHILGEDMVEFIEKQGGFIHYQDQGTINWQQYQQRSNDFSTATTKLIELSCITIHFFYLPHLTVAEDIIAVTKDGQYHAVIAAATIIPAAAKFCLGGVRIGAGTGNMQSRSFQASAGKAIAPLMNTPSFNSRVTAQMVFKAILAYRPRTDWQQMHGKVIAGVFDTGRDLVDYPTSALFGFTIAILGFGHIGREVAKLAKTFAMTVKVYARQKYQPYIESLGYVYCATLSEACDKADILSPHLGLGADGCNIGIIDNALLQLLNRDALVVNFDRGELINIEDLQGALTSGKVGFVAVDADIFTDQYGDCTGPLQGYRQLAQDHNKLLLLPHVAADIDHLSRLAGAKQAVKQIISVIIDKVVINAVGTIPAGFKDGGKQTLVGIGAVTPKQYQSLNQDTVSQIAELSQQMAHFWQTYPQQQQQLLLTEEQVSQMTLLHNQLTYLLDKHGLTGMA